jgi:hypothetical protein
MNKNQNSKQYDLEERNPSSLGFSIWSEVEVCLAMTKGELKRHQSHERAEGLTKIIEPL